MRIGFWTALAVAVTALSGCVKENTVLGHEPGTPIVFGVSTQWENGIQTRTEYSGKDENDAIVSAGSQYERIDWVEGKDRIRILCEAAGGGDILSGHGSDYLLGEATVSGEKSQAGISPCGENTLYWGTGNHYFYAMYPAPDTESPYAFTRDNPVTAANAKLEPVTGNKAKLTGVIPTVQQAIRDGSTLVFKPNMNYAYMYARKTVSESDASGAIDLSFQPLVTTFEFSLKNFASSPVTQNLTRVELISASTPLTGTFTATLSPDGTPVINTVGTTGNTATINLPSPGIALSDTDPVQFTFFTLPVDQTELTLMLSFGSDYAIKRQLNLKDSGKITAQNPEGWITAEAGKKVYVRNLSVPGGDLWSYTLDVTGNYSTAIPAAGGTINYNVTSHKTSLTDASSQPDVAWTTQYSVDGGAWTDTMPDWLEDFPATGTGPLSNTATLSVNNTGKLWEGTTVPIATSQASARDLSCYDIYGNFTGGVEGEFPYNTANCYVVGAPGWYRIPCVYGNAIKNGADNPSAYTGPESGEKLLTGHFLNHADAPITSPWIKNNKSGTAADSPDIVIDGAELMWQDHSGLITELAYDADYLYFYVDPANIFQGNALLAAKSGTTIVWSWHIWVMDKPEEKLATKTLYSHPTVNHSIQDPLQILPMDLGFCDTAPGAAPARSVRVKFIQDQSNLEKVITITQRGSVSYSCTYYQWGRKDPIRPGIVSYATTSTSGTGSDKPIYDINGNQLNPTVLQGNVTIGTAVQHPSQFIKGESWSSQYDNLWNTNVTIACSRIPSGTVYGHQYTEDIWVNKTIYDPNPIGFKMPNKNVFSGFTYSGVDEVTMPAGPDQASVVYSLSPVQDFDAFDSLLGLYFYLDQLDFSKGTIFMPRTGARRFNTGDMDGLGRWADRSSATPASIGGAQRLSYLTFGKNTNGNFYVRPWNFAPRAQGMPVRAIAE